MAVTDPKPMSRAAAVAYAICSPLGLIALVFLPVGLLDWKPGWIFVAFLVAAFGASALILARVNPSIYRARSRFQPGTKRWDLGPGRLDLFRHDHRGPASDPGRWSHVVVIDAAGIRDTWLRPTWHWNRAQRLGSSSQPLL